MPYRPALTLLFAWLAIATAHEAVAQPGTPACKRELAVTHDKMQQVLTLTGDANNLPPKEACQAYFKTQELLTEIRGGFERCEPDNNHAAAIENVDIVDAELTKTINRACPPRPGMIRINAIFIKRIGVDEMPKGLAAIHKCGTLPRAVFINEPFENGRLMLAGCQGKDNAGAAESSKRNANTTALADEQVAVYLALDSTGRGARRLTLPILLADGKESTTDLIPATGASPQSRDRLAGNWAPAKDGVCRIHAEWKMRDGKPNLVLWQELEDCSKSGPPAFKTILDRR